VSRATDCLPPPLVSLLEARRAQCWVLLRHAALDPIHAGLAHQNTSARHWQSRGRQRLLILIMHATSGLDLPSRHVSLPTYCMPAERMADADEQFADGYSQPDAPGKIVKVTVGAGACGGCC
jgi:hypothetical protein